jgi:hypothetical protein
LRTRKSALKNFFTHLFFLIVPAGLLFAQAEEAALEPRLEDESPLFASRSNDLFDQTYNDSLFRDLELVDKITKQVNDQLPFFYNYSMVGGYFVMPSGRMPKSGVVGIGGAYVPPYTIYGVNFQILDRVELSANYRVYNGVSEPNFGHEGFGDDAERIGNIKIGILTPQDGFPMLPTIAVGADDFIGTKRFNSQYVVMTKQFLDWNLECTLGWGKKRLKGFFGGAAWSPFRNLKAPLLKDISFIAEYDATDYKKHPHEHPSGRKVKSRINGGISLVGWDTLQLSVSSIRGTDVAASASLRYPIGSSQGIFPKVDDPSTYQSPVDTEPLGTHRLEEEFVQDLTYALSDQGLDLYTAFLMFDAEGNRTLWLKVVNNRYREEKVVRLRVEHVLAALTPSNIKSVIVVIEADAVPCQAYYFRTEDLCRWRLGQISDFELATVGPMKDPPPTPSEYDAALLFQRKKPIWTFTVLPRLLTFFGAASGKFKYNLSAVAYPEGYIFNQVYYKFTISYALASSMSGLGSPDRLNPSKLPNVRTDSMKYYQANSFSMEQAFLQRSWSFNKGWYYRLAAGYFEPAYGGAATEILYYPVGSNWAVGLEFAAVMKREYHGIKFSRTVREYRDGHLRNIPFVGIQYFLDLYYDFKPLNMDLLITAGKFLAKDKGARFEVGRYFKSGLRFALWYTVTNGHDHVNGHTYYDKGFIFSLPLDMFLKQSSRTYLSYAMSAWLRDVGARSATGKQLYWTLEKERYNY